MILFASDLVAIATFLVLRVIEDSERERGKESAFRDDNASSVDMYTWHLVCFPYVTYLHFKTEKETSVFSSSLVTCAAELCTQHIPYMYTRNVEYDVRA